MALLLLVRQVATGAPAPRFLRRRKLQPAGRLHAAAARQLCLHLELIGTAAAAASAIGSGAVDSPIPDTTASSLSLQRVQLRAQLAYCFWLKHQPVLDICIVASGFLLRAIAGGAATGIPLSQWFLLSAGFGSLFMVAGKRYAEMMLAERTGAKIRKSLESYSASYLRFVWGLAATVLISTYCLWAFELREAQPNNTVWSVISIVPFVVAVLRYAVDVDNGDGGEPEEIALGDRVLQVLALAWIGTLAVAVYI